MTLAKWQVVLTADCSSATIAAQVGTPITACATAQWGNDGTQAYGWKHFQPKETSDKVYTGPARYSKGETLVYKGLLLATGVPSVACGTGKVLTGASALVAGAAIAFGAAALAF
jgi:hypothetical protein